MGKKIKAYKAMEKDMTCRGKQYEVGKTYVEDEADCCRSGMHACTDPFDVLHYYNLASCRLFEVECGGKVSKGADGSKIACTKMTVKGELSVSDLVELGVKAVIEKSKNSSTTTFCSNSTAATSVREFTAAAFGNCSTAVASGTCSTAATSGNRSVAATSSNCSTAVASGDLPIAASTGRESTTAASGYRSTAVANGRESTAAASGNCSTAATSGGCSIAVASGSWSAAKATGKSSIAVANGYNSKASGSIGTYLVLTEYEDERNLICAKMEKVDGERIKEDTLYMLKNGEFVEVE